MNLCSSGHEEVCYETRDCPFCEKIAELEKDIENLADEISDLKGQIAELESDDS